MCQDLTKHYPKYTAEPNNMVMLTKVAGGKIFSSGLKNCMKKKSCEPVLIETFKDKNFQEFN